MSKPFKEKWEYDQNPDKPDKKGHDFRDDLLTLSDKEIIETYQIYHFAEHGVGIVLNDGLDNGFEIGLSHGRMYSVSNSLDNYCTISEKQKIDFIADSRRHRLQEILMADD